MQTTTERRHESSTRIAYGLPIALSHEGFHDSFEAECVDLSPGGLSLRSSCLPGVGETLNCHFDAPNAGQRIEVRGEVVWAHLEGHRGGEFGLRFLDVEATTIGLISEMIAEGEARIRHQAAQHDDTAKLAVDGSSDTFTARLLRRSSGLVTFEQDLSFLKLGRGVSAFQGDDVQRGEIASVAVRLEGGTPKLMVTLRYAPSDAPDDAHTRDEAVTVPVAVTLPTAPTAEHALRAERFDGAITDSDPRESISHDTVPDLAAPTREPTGKHAVTLTEFAAAYHTHASEPGNADAPNELPRLSTRSEFDLPSAIEEAESLRPAATADAQVDASTDAFADEDPGPALFTADEISVADGASVADEDMADSACADAEQTLEALDARDETESDEDARYEAAAARVLGERAAHVDATHPADVSTVGRCDPAVMFKVDESDEDFRMPRSPAALTVAAGICLSLIATVRGFALAMWQRLQVKLQDKLLPQLRTRVETLTQAMGPKAQALWSRARERSLPWLRTAMHRTVDTLHSVSERVSGRGQRRRTAGIPIAAVQSAPTVNRRSQVVATEQKRTLHRVVLAVVAVVGLGLAGYALLSAPDPHVVPVHREISAAPAQAPSNGALEAAPVTSTAAAVAVNAPAIAVGAPAVELPASTTRSAVQLPAMPTALPAPSYEAGRIAAPSYPTIERAAPAAPKPVATSAPAVSSAELEGTGAMAVQANEASVVTSNASANAMRFGAASIVGRHFSLQMSAPIRAVSGTADVSGFSVVIDGALSLDRAGPIAASHSAVARAMILNKGDRAELTIRFTDGKSPKFQVLAKGDRLEITIAE